MVHYAENGCVYYTENRCASTQHVCIVPQVETSKTVPITVFSFNLYSHNVFSNVNQSVSIYVTVYWSVTEKIKVNFFFTLFIHCLCALRKFL